MPEETEEETEEETRETNDDNETEEATNPLEDLKSKDIDREKLKKLTDRDDITITTRGRYKDGAKNYYLYCLLTIACIIVCIKMRVFSSLETIFLFPPKT